VDNCTLRDNSAPRGGALLISGGSARIKSTIFERNTGTTSGGALQVEGGTVELASETHFLENSAPMGAAL
jgi:predicted outer membrane repeat protein